MISRIILSIALGVLVAIAASGCGGPAAPTGAPPTDVVPSETPRAPAGTPAKSSTAAPTEAPAQAPTEPPTVELTPTTPPETISFTWAPGAVPPSDADDVDVIITELKGHGGILGGTGNEIGISIFYDPALITVEEIEEILREMGHPVVRQ